MARITHRILKREGYGNRTFHFFVTVGVIAITLTIICAFSRTFCILQTLFVRLTIGAHTSLNSLSIGVEFRGLCTTIVGKIFVQRILV